jgi:hypothetical protein
VTFFKDQSWLLSGSIGSLSWWSLGSLSSFKTFLNGWFHGFDEASLSGFGSSWKQEWDQIEPSFTLHWFWFITTGWCFTLWWSFAFRQIFSSNSDEFFNIESSAS